jgi:hypothetical protein
VSPESWSTITGWPSEVASMRVLGSFLHIMEGSGAICLDGHRVDNSRNYCYALELCCYSSSNCWLDEYRSIGTIPIFVSVRILYSQTQLIGSNTVQTRAKVSWSYLQ